MIILYCSGSKVSFLSSGLTDATLKQSGTIASWRDRFKICVIEGRRTFKDFLSKQVGIGSNTHVEDGEDIMTLHISSCDTNSKVDSCVAEVGKSWE